jgi:aquaporin Z
MQPVYPFSIVSRLFLPFRGYLNELFASFTLAVGIALMLDPVSGVTGTGAAIGIGFLVASVIYVNVYVMSGYVNPLFTVAAWGVGHIRFLRALIYTILQSVGAILGVILAWYLSCVGTSLCVPYAPVLPIVSDWVRSSVNELTWSTALTFAFLMLALGFTARQKNSQFFGIGVGFMMVTAVLAGAYISGASYNPALTLGPMILRAVYDSDIARIWTMFIHLGAQYLGALVATIMFYIMGDWDPKVFSVADCASKSGYGEKQSSESRSEYNNMNDNFKQYDNSFSTKMVRKSGEQRV